MEPEETTLERVEEEAVYLLGGVVGVLSFIIVATFSLSVIDRYLVGSPQLAAVVSAVLVDLTNEDRAANAVGGLTVNPLLTAAAQAKANDMAAKGYFAHVDPSDPTRNSWVWFREAGYRFSYAGENLAVDFSDSPDVQRAWMNSPTHRRNILDGHFTEIGIATARGTYKGRSTTFVVQMFGTPSEGPSRVITLASPAVATEPALATVQGAVASTAPKAAATSAPITKPLAQAATTSTTTTQATLVLGVGAEGFSEPAPTLSSWWHRVIASPKTTLRSVYYALGLIVIVLLAYVTGLEVHKRHMRHVIAASSLFVLMAALLVVAEFFIFTTPRIAALSL